MHSDLVIVGGGHNALVAAALLAKAGLKPLVLERSERVGGCAITSEIAPGFRCPTLAHTAAIDPEIVRLLDLERHGLQIIRSEAAICAPGTDGRSLILWSEPHRAAAEVAKYSKKDAGRYQAFLDSFRATSGVVRALATLPPPSIDAPNAADLVDLVKTGRLFRRLGRTDAYRLLRWMPMAVADLVGEWFESEPLKAAIAAGGTLGSFLGPWSAGSGALLLMLGATERSPIASGWLARGGTGAVSDALANAARRAGAEIRTGAEVAELSIKDGAVTGVTLAGGETISTQAIVSGADVKRTLLGLVDPINLPPEFVRRVQNIRAHGTLAKINYAVSALPEFQGLAALDPSQRLAALSGRVRLADDIDSIERAFDAAKYGRSSDEPWIELTIPSITDATLAPAGRHVISAYVQFAPYRLRGTTWEQESERLAKAATTTLAKYAPGFEGLVLAREVITPLDLERTYGLTGGHIFHGELALDQWLVTRPLIGWSRYATPIRNLFLCGSGTHPGTGLNGRSGMLAAREVRKALKRALQLK